VPFANSQALVAQHQLIASFDHLNPHVFHPRAQISDVDCVESGMSAMNFQERYQGFNGHPNDFSMASEAGNFSVRHHRPVTENLELSSLAVSSPTQWNLHSPIQSGDSAHVPTSSRKMFSHNQEARDAMRVVIDSTGDHTLNSPSSASSPYTSNASQNSFSHPLITPPTCAKVLLPEFSQEFSSKKLFLGPTILV
jgi:hypothetical protein